MRHKVDKVIDTSAKKIAVSGYCPKVISKQVNYKRPEYKRLLTAETEARDARRKTRSAKQQLAKLDAGKHTAKKERARLTKQIKN